MIKKCLNCGIEFYVKPCRVDRTKFHNKECLSIYRKNNPMPKEIREKISKTKGGISVEKKICVGCGIEFEVPKWSKQIYHDRQCSSTTIGKLSTNPWNKNLTKEDDERLKISGEQHSKWMKEQYESGEMKIWNKGLTKDTDPRVADYVAKQTVWRNTDSDAKEAWKEAMSKGQVKAHSDGKYSFTFTKPEQITWAHLESLGHTVKPYSERSDNDPENTWYHQYPFEKFVPDFACPDLKGIIEVNGCYHHGHRKCSKRAYKIGQSDYVDRNIKRDRQKYSLYYRRGWKWALVWECEAHNGDFHRIEEYL